MSELDDSFAVLLGRQPSDKRAAKSLPGPRRSEAQEQRRRVAPADGAPALRDALQTASGTHRGGGEGGHEGRPRDGSGTGARRRGGYDEGPRARSGGSGDGIGEESSRGAEVEVDGGLLSGSDAYASRRSVGGHTVRVSARDTPSGTRRRRDRYESAAAMASWANTPEGQLAYQLAKAGSLRELATCSGHGWFERDGACYPGARRTAGGCRPTSRAEASRYLKRFKHLLECLREEPARRGPRKARRPSRGTDRGACTRRGPSPSRRREIARQAARARWEVLPESLRSLFPGYVLERDQAPRATRPRDVARSDPWRTRTPSLARSTIW